MKSSAAGARMGTAVREQDIVHECGDFWVHRDQTHDRYTVYRAGSTHSESDSSYPFTPDGMSLAVARANYLDRRARRNIPDLAQAARSVRWFQGYREPHQISQPLATPGLEAAEAAGSAQAATRSRPRGG